MLHFHPHTYTYTRSHILCCVGTRYKYLVTFLCFLQTTHLVVNNADKSAESYKGRMAQKYGIPIVSTSFVDVSVERGELVEPDDYLAVGKTAAEQFQTGKIIGTIS